MEYYIKEGNWKQTLEFLKSIEGVHTRNEERLRRFIEAIWYIVRSGYQWRLLPRVYGFYRSIDQRFKRWCKKRIWEKLLKYTAQEADLEISIIDGTIIRAHSCSAGYGKFSQTQEALGRSKGGFTTKIHALVDALGNPPKIYSHARSEK